MDNYDLKHHEFENDIQRFMQIRDQVHDEIKRIATHVTTLDQTNKRLIAHFDVIKELTNTADKQIRDSISGASHQMVKTCAAEFSQTIKESLRGRLTELDAAIQKAQHVLKEATEDRHKRTLQLAFAGCCFALLIGSGTGYYYAKKHTYTLPDNFVRTYVRGLNTKVESLEKQVQERQKKKK